MILTQLLNDFGTGRGKVPENSGYAGFANEAVDNWFGKTIRIGRKRLVQNYPCHLPMSRSGVFAVRTQGTTTVRAARLIYAWHSLEWTNVSQADALQIWQV